MLATAATKPEAKTNAVGPNARPDGGKPSSLAVKLPMSMVWKGRKMSSGTHDTTGTSS